MSENPYLYALTVDPDKPLREAKKLVAQLAAERDRLIAERDRLTAERDEARRRLSERAMDDLARLDAETRHME